METSSNANTFTAINKYFEGAAIQIASGVSTHLPCCLSKGPLKHGFLDIYLTIFFGAGISGNTTAMRVIFFQQMFKIEYRFVKCSKKYQKKLFVFDVIASELVALNCLYQADNVCHRLPMCQQTVLGFCLSLKHTFSNATTFTVINKNRKSAIIQTATVFRPIFHVLCLTVL